ncbi:acyl-CoA synthase [Nitrococcus mobilis Nb-231]|uniref:Acyl-CoA synthase n=1 Tax=Nitrococcus mobilis Nb-231 TaxID=314278 RepID=A4BMX2_9GAMM|nr:acyl-CoA synthase [Nitrococcus mobilis Nb-231]
MDYAAQGVTGYNFYDGRGRLRAALPYAELRQRAQATAKRLHGLGLKRGERVALIAETCPEFMEFFYACQYGGFVPVPLPITINLGSRGSYIERLRRLLHSCSATAAMAPAEFLSFLQEAADGLKLRFVGSPADFYALEEPAVELESSGPDEIAYLQYTSGSTRFPRGVVITQQAVMANLAGIVGTGLAVRPGDRCVSWLPFYHDMGLVGFVLGPLASQLSVDYLGTRDFAMRPRQWLALISNNRGTIAFAPPFGYDICARRIHRAELDRYDLSCWRVAGVGAETIHAETLERFADFLAPAGFNRHAFLPCYGLAESSLAVTFAALDQGMVVDQVDRRALEDRMSARAFAATDGRGERVRAFVNCGRPLPGHEVIVRDADYKALPHRQVGIVSVRGPSLMSGYFQDAASTHDALGPDGWLDTGDLGYLTEAGLFITGRCKDLIIVNGRNIWPQDMERLAEEQPEVRLGDVTAFVASHPKGGEIVVMLVQCRLTENERRADLVNRLQRMIYSEFGIKCRIELVPPKTLPRTSSGKLSRSEARRRFIQRVGWNQRSEIIVEAPKAAVSS